MPARQNKIKRMLNSGKASIGLFHSLGSPLAAEMLGHAGFDWVIIDGEHSTNDVPAIRDTLVALDAASTPAVVRIVGNDVNLVKQLMDAGAQTLLVPMVETAQQAQLMVRAMLYPPQGIRGVASGTRAGQFGMARDYLGTANSEACLIVQIESMKAMANLSDIAMVEGVDCLFIGPSDLAADMGHLGNPAHPEVQDAIAEGLGKIRKKGKAAGIYSSDPEQAGRLASMGANFIAGGTDLGVLSKALALVASNLRRAVQP